MPAANKGLPDTFQCETLPHAEPQCGNGCLMLLGTLTPAENMQVTGEQLCGQVHQLMPCILHAHRCWCTHKL